MICSKGMRGVSWSPMSNGIGLLSVDKHGFRGRLQGETQPSAEAVYDPLGHHRRAVKEIFSRHGFMRIVAAVLIAHEDHPNRHTGRGIGSAVMGGRATDVERRNALGPRRS